MGTEIAEIQGRYESSQNGDLTPKYETSTITLKRFYGGIEKGTMVQLTLQGPGFNYVQLDKDQIKELIGALMECI